jgi:hypothetical protein
MNNIVRPRKASSETKRSGMVVEPEGVLIRRESLLGDKLASGHVDKGRKSRAKVQIGAGLLWIGAKVRRQGVEAVSG